jgi:HD-like signal output (HDOD) protein
MSLFSRIKNAFVRRQEPGREQAEKHLQTLLEGYELPSFPAVVMNVLSSLRDPQVNMAAVAEQLEADPGLHVKVLRLVNSAAFALANDVTNLHRAVTLLGRARLETMVLTHAVTDKISAECPAGFDADSFWLAAARRAFIARSLASLMGVRAEVETFTVGLLQDMAVPVLAARLGSSYQDLLAAWRDDPDLEPLDRLEQQRFELDHPTVGALMAKNWGLPDYLVKGIALHHEAAEQKEPVAAASFIVSPIKMSMEPDQQARLIASAKTALSLPEKAVEERVEAALEQADAFASQLR